MSWIKDSGSQVSNCMLSLDYEVFFGSDSGSPAKCLIEPMMNLNKVCKQRNAKMTIFVDAGYLVRLEKDSSKYSLLGEHLVQIQTNLRQLAEDGHDLQLHVHPHWEDAEFDGERWNFEMKRYRLHAFSIEEQLRLIAEYKFALEKVALGKVIAFRAGGWCIQPFDEIKTGLAENGIWIDSTVYRGGYSNDPMRWIDFRSAPDRPSWRFLEDPVVVDVNGSFLEVPISTLSVPPSFYWRMALMRLFKPRSRRTFGDGSAMVSNSGYYLGRMVKESHMPVSIDGEKASLLDRAFASHLQFNSSGCFNVMGHPKSISPYSIQKFDDFCVNNNVKFSSISELYSP